MIPGAVHAPRGMLEFWVDPESPYHRDVFASGKKFLFYCASGWRSALATQAVQRMGLEPVAHNGGGLTAWRESGGPVEEKEDKKKAGRRLTARPTENRQAFDHATNQHGQKRSE